MDHPGAIVHRDLGLEEVAAGFLEPLDPPIEPLVTLQQAPVSRRQTGILVDMPGGCRGGSSQAGGLIVPGNGQAVQVRGEFIDRLQLVQDLRVECLSRPLFQFAADDKIICKADQKTAPFQSRLDFLDIPFIQYIMEKDVRKQGRYDSTLRRPLLRMT